MAGSGTRRGLPRLMAGTGPQDLQILAEEFLAACVEALDTIPTFAPGLGGSPERFFIAPGQPVYDCCPQLSVHVGPVSEGVSAPPVPTASYARVNRVTLVATIIRCLPGPDKSGNPPSAEDQQDSAIQIHADRWALWNHIWNMQRAGLIFQRCGDVIWDGIVPVIPQGGCGGSVLTLRVSYDGYEEAL